MSTIRLSDQDWNILLPGEFITIGKQQIEIKPLGLGDLSLLMRELRLVIGKCSEAGITLDNYESHFVSLAGIVLEEAPAIITLLINLDPEDVKRLPVAIATKILIACFRINIDSQDDLKKNLLTLTNQVAALEGAGGIQEQESEA